MKLYAVADGPPSLACRMILKALNLDYELIDVDFCKGEHLTADYAKLNPQQEIPVLVDDDLMIGESNAIMQYICDKYDLDGKYYPKDPKVRAIVNHRLCFNLAWYYRNILEYALAPIFFDYERTALGLKKMNMGLNIFEEYLSRTNTLYVAADYVTIADFALINATMGLAVIKHSLSCWPRIEKWFNNFKIKHPELWEIAAGGLEELEKAQQNPPDLSHMYHPFHPTRSAKQ